MVRKEGRKEAQMPPMLHDKKMPGPPHPVPFWLWARLFWFCNFSTWAHQRTNRQRDKPMDKSLLQSCAYATKKMLKLIYYLAVRFCDRDSGANAFAL